MARGGGTEAKAKHPWRENIEALSMAIVVALLFKVFVLEISRIPSGSMQPTLLGDPGTQVFDRVLVDKLSMHLRDPLRWEIVVFKHPLERSRVMVKRLVGMPDEHFMIAKGDLWTRPDEDTPWTVLRRPAPVQEEMWLELVASGEAASWSVVGGGRAWRLDAGRIEAEGEGRVRFQESQGPIRDTYLDGYPETLQHEMRGRPGVQYVGDVRVAGELRPGEDLELLTVQLTEGQRTYEFRLPGPAASGARPAITVHDPAAEPRERTVVLERDLRLAAGETVAFAAENLDDRLTLELDGEALLTLDVPPADDQRAFLTLGISGGRAVLEELRVLRDVYYLPDPDRTVPAWRQRIPADHYLMLGDNTQDSADSRDWKAKRMYPRSDRAQEEPVTARGNYRPGENPIEARGPEGEALYRFLDEWGEAAWLPKAEVAPGLEFRAPFVPRHLIQGRAVAVFWPLKPHRSLWRLTWLH